MDGRETMRRDRNYPPFWNHPPEFFCQIHGDNSSHDTSHCIVLRKEFAMLYPEFMGVPAPTAGSWSSYWGTWIWAREVLSAAAAAAP